MRVLQNLFAPFSTRLSDEEIIGRIQEGGIPARRAIAQFYDAHLQQARYLRRDFPYLGEEDLLFAYSTAVTQLVAKIEQGVIDDRAKLSTFLQSILRRRCIDLHRKQKTEWKKKTLEERKVEPFEEDLESEAAVDSAATQPRAALIIQMDQEQLPNVKDENFTMEENLISQEFIAEIKNRIGGKPWEVLLYRAEGYGPKEIAEKFKFNSVHSATQSCSAYRKNLHKIIREMQAEGW